MVTNFEYSTNKLIFRGWGRNDRMQCMIWVEKIEWSWGHCCQKLIASEIELKPPPPKKKEKRKVKYIGITKLMGHYGITSLSKLNLIKS